MTSKGLTRGRRVAGALLALTFLVAATGWAQGMYYREVEKEGRIYVFNLAKECEAFEKGGEMGKSITRLGYGPNGETVVFDSEDAINLYNFKHDKPGEAFKKEAAKVEEGPSFKVAPTIFADYTYTDAPIGKDADGNAINNNAFNVARAYINLTGRVGHVVSYRVTADIKANTNSTANDASLSGSNVFRLKYAFLQFELDDFLTHGSWARIGMQHTPIIDFQEGLYRYRFQGTVFAEREGLLTSSDYAIGGRYVFPEELGDVHLGVYNGDGYSKFEANDQKAFQARVAFRPLPRSEIGKGLRLVGFADWDHSVKEAARTRYVAALCFEHTNVNAAFEYVSAIDSSSATKPETKAEGFSIWATPRTSFGLEGLLRYDSLKPDTSAEGKKTRLIVGAAYWFKTFKGAQAALLADYENVKYDDNLPTALVKPEERRFSLHTLLSF
jgi:hypothetical protein